MEHTITILGSGIMGLMTAYTLADHHKVTLHDPAGFPPDNATNNASFMAGGMLAPYSEIEHMDESWTDAGLRGIDIWKDIDLPTGFTQNGSLLISHAEDRHILERFKAHLPMQKQTSQNVQDLEPHLAQKHTHGLFLEEEAHLNPGQTMRALSEYLKDKITFEQSSAQPQNCKTDWIIDCRGMGTNDGDIRGVKGETLLVGNREFTLSRPVRLMHPRYPLYIIPRENNVFMIGATIIESADSAAVSLRSSMELMSALYALSPTFAESEIIDIKAGIRPSYPGNLPRITIKDKVIQCNGLFRHGYLLSPVMAQCVRDHISGEENKFMSLFTHHTQQGTDNENHNKRAA